MEGCLVWDPPIDWDLFLLWCNNHLKGRSLFFIVCKLCLGASVYHLWKQRNALLHGNPLHTEESLVLQVNRDVRLRLLARCSPELIRKNPQLAEIWSLQHILQG
jgi:hypothetical protein